MIQESSADGVRRYEKRYELLGLATVILITLVLRILLFGGKSAEHFFQAGYYIWQLKSGAIPSLDRPGYFLLAMISNQVLNVDWWIVLKILRVFIGLTNVLLVYVIAKEISKDENVPVVASFFFAILYLECSYMAVGPFRMLLGESFFILFLTFLVFLKIKRKPLRHLTLSLLPLTGIFLSHRFVAGFAVIFIGTWLGGMYLEKSMRRFLRTEKLYYIVPIVISASILGLFAVTLFVYQSFPQLYVPSLGDYIRYSVSGWGSRGLASDLRHPEA